jgi:hypothetical protein
LPSVGLTVRLVTCTDARNRGSGHTQSKENSTFFNILGIKGLVESKMKEIIGQFAGNTPFL